MRHIATTAVIALTLVTGCGPKPTITAHPDKPKTTSKQDGQPNKQTAAIGDTLTLTGQEPGQKLAVTLKKWADPVKSTDAYTTPQNGKRWVAAQFELKNTGTVTYADSPSNGAQVADSDGQRFHSTIAGGITAGPEMTADLKLPVGEKALGWIVFEIPKDSKAASVQFTMNSGFAQQTGQWTIKQ